MYYSMLVKIEATFCSPEFMTINLLVPLPCRILLSAEGTYINLSWMTLEIGSLTVNEVKETLPGQMEIQAKMDIKQIHISNKNVMLCAFYDLQIPL